MKRWIIQDRYGNMIYLTQERWEHITDPINHPEMSDYENHIQKTIIFGTRKQDFLNPQKYRYSMAFDDLPESNTHIVVIARFSFVTDSSGKLLSNNYIVTAYQKEIERK